MSTISLGRLVILAVISGLVVSAPQTVRDEQVTVIKEFNNHGTDEFNWSYELSDGRQVQQKATVKMLPDGTKLLVVDGFYSYVGPDGVKYSVHYTADENGYHPKLSTGDVQIIEVHQVGLDPKVLASLLG
ncbi:endocuticle structural glycoprotein ABD-5-like [Culex pipiens pallens]|uniref:endocuticle structural glycoprotein ABD-5-like n=1 Tax=Culex pipiens pallens TaxID=42434 RepID=UPI0019538001|nr:endocuticle structural glycoprotein ABD-5-like [Culex pipiens pallens]